MLPSIFQQALPIIKKLKQNGHEAYFVGGSVRDYLLARSIGDIDITSSATVEEIIDIFEKTIPVGVEHGTVIVRHNKVSYEVTTYRSSSAMATNLKEDLRRRDFTINALAMDEFGEIIDFFSGKKDINNRIIRGIDSPVARLTEDPLRIVRALRFMSELNFQIDEKTLQAMTDKSTLLADIAVERIVVEWTKLIKGQAVDIAFENALLTNTLDNIPVFQSYLPLFRQMEKPIQPFISLSEFIAYIAYKDKSFSIAKSAKALKYANDIKHDAIQLKSCLDHYDKNKMDDWFVYQTPTSLISSMVNLVQRLFPEDAISEVIFKKAKTNLPIQQREQLMINGRELIDLFPDKKPGPWLQETLQSIEKAVVIGEILNNKKEIKEWIACHPPGVN